MPAKVSPSLKILTEMRDELKRGNSRLGVVEKRLEAYQEPSPEGFRLVRFHTDRDTVRPASVPPSIPGDVAVGDLLPPAESRG